MATKWQQRWRAKHGDFAVPCVVRGRWWEFSQRGSARIMEGEAITLTVKTEGADEQPRKLCELIVTREDLMRVLGIIDARVKSRNLRVLSSILAWKRPLLS
jgi:hypothetical protein